MKDGALIRLRGLDSHYGASATLKETDLAIASGEVRATIGPSGSGKNTSLCRINWLDAPDRATISIRPVEFLAGGRIIEHRPSRRVMCDPQQRRTQCFRHAVHDR